MGLFGTVDEWGVGKKTSLHLTRMCHTYPTKMKLKTVILHLKKNTKYINDLKHTFSSADISIFSLEIPNFCCIEKNIYRLYFDTSFLNLLNFPESLKVVLETMVLILMMSAILATLGILKKRYFKIKVITSWSFPWGHQQSFITWLKLYCRCCQVIKVWQI